MLAHYESFLRGLLHNFFPVCAHYSLAKRDCAVTGRREGPISERTVSIGRPELTTSLVRFLK